jgi:hypothetical protein
MEPKMRIDINTLVSDLESLGAKVEYGSNKPGVYTTVEDTLCEVRCIDVFPELKALQDNSFTR